MNQETKICKHCQSEIPKKAKVCPQCRKKQGGKLKWIIIGIVVVLIIVMAAGGGDDESKQASESNTEQENAKAKKDKKKVKEDEPQEEISYAPYSVSQMMNDLDDNAMNAETNYKNQYVEITGILSNIDSSGKYISLFPEDNEYAFIGVQCYIKTDDQKSKVEKMSKGDTVTLRGKVTSVGEVLGYSLDIDEIL